VRLLICIVEGSEFDKGQTKNDDDTNCKTKLEKKKERKIENAKTLLLLGNCSFGTLRKRTIETKRSGKDLNVIVLASDTKHARN